MCEGFKRCSVNVLRQTGQTNQICYTSRGCPCSVTLPPPPNKGLPLILRNWIIIVWVVIQELLIFCCAEPFKQLVGWSWRLWICCMENLQLCRVVFEVSGRVPVQVIVITNPLCSVLQFLISQVGAPTGTLSVVYGKNLQKHQCNYIKAYGEPLHQSSFKCKLGRLHWPAISVASRLWNQLNALVDVASKIHAMFSSTVQTRQGPECAILHRGQGGSWITGPTLHGQTWYRGQCNSCLRQAFWTSFRLYQTHTESQKRT